MELYIGIAVAVVVILIIIAIAVTFGMRGRRSRRLQQGFGPEYDRTVAATGDRTTAECELDARQERRSHFDIRPLGASERQRYATQWMAVQERFVDAPQQALADADRMVGVVMADRGYPMDDFDQMANDVSVDHPGEVSDYRAAHEIAGLGVTASTEQMRVAMQRYRSLFDSLLREDAGSRASASTPIPGGR